MAEYLDEQGGLTEDFKTALPTLLGDDFYNDPDKKQPTKYFENVKDLPTLLKRAVNADRTISRHGETLKKATEGMVKIPGEGATPEELAAYRKAIGVPDTVDKYSLKPKDGPYKEEDQVLITAICNAAHKVGIPDSKLAAVYSDVEKILEASRTAAEEKGMKLLSADVQALKDAKREKYDAFITDTNKVAAHFDVKGDAALGTKDNLIGGNFMKLMDSMGIKDTPVVREFLGAIAPLVLEGSSVIGRGAPSEPGKGGFEYKYDENGKPIV